ncbi:hypothetical protein COUCH_14110 [Couchioplanes caeruleus]|uniref:hypothetical protein n=1 Tax=Couchioplanes caeruleus TaxID=56438 RepID=UPI0020C035EA|nr:hypothetical protein [Couchioplanes caeruleus]UQU67327.1 hypothetical protein COUCH_14110 [Couchioplanes caeruleus]
MFSRHVLKLAVAGATLAAGIGYAVPAAASVRYDPAAKAGFAGATDVRKAFGWSDAALAAHAAGLAFSHEFWTEDTYAVSCGAGPFTVRHQREFGRFELADREVREPRRGASAGYGAPARLAGFRITGPYAGISGTSVPPAVGGPCPEPRGQRITRATLTATTTGWSLTVSSGATTRVLRHGPGGL